MAETARCYRTGLMTWLKALSVLAHTRSTLKPLVEAGLRIRLTKSEADFIVPSPHHGQFVGDEAMLTAFEALRTELATYGKIFARQKTEASSTNLDEYSVPAAALAFMAANIPPDGAEAAQPIETEHYALAIDDDETRLAAAVGTAVWQAPGVRLEASAGDGEQAVFLQFGDDAATVAAAHAYAVAGRHEGFHLLDAYHCGSVRLLLPRPLSTGQRARPSRPVLEAFGKAIATCGVFAEGTQGGAGDALAVLPSQVVWQVRLPQAGAAQTAAGFKPENEGAIEIVFRSFKPEAEALARLEQAWNRLPKAGHRLDLRPVPPNVGGGEKPEQLMEKIRALQRKHALSLALQAPQFRLLRFSSRQVVAMVEALRAMPPETIDQGTIRYGFHASDADPLGSHFLAWSTDEVAAERPFEEHFLRSQTEDIPITYWIDPAWAKFHHDQGGRVKSRIMVPRHYRLSPTLHAFRSKHEDDMDLFLRKRFADGGPLPAGEEPIYLVSPSMTVGFSHTVETLDFGAFHPFRTQLPWVSNVLEILGSIELRDVIAEAGDVSRRQALLDRMREKSAQDRKDLDDAATELIGTLGRRLGNYLGGLSREVDALSGHIAQFVTLMDQLTLESEQAEEYVAAIVESAAGRAERIAHIARESKDLATERKAVNEGLVRAVTTTDAFVATARARLEAAEGELDRLRRLIDRTGR